MSMSKWVSAVFAVLLLISFAVARSKFPSVS